MKFLPSPAFHYLPMAACMVVLSCPCPVRAQTLPENLAPTQTRLVLAQASPATAVSSQAVATQPTAPSRLTPPQKAPEKPAAPAVPQTKPQVLDPLLDLNRPRSCQVGILKSQTLRCGEVEVVLPAGIYEQVRIVEGPQERTAAASADLKSQAKGLGYIRYLAEGKIKVNGEERAGGLDIGVRASDRLPLRVWYKKFNPPDDTTKALGFIFPPIMIAAGAGAWSSGNTLIPDSDPEFTENRNYFLKENNAQAAPGSGDADLYKIKPAEAAKAASFQNPYLPPPAVRSR